VRRERFDFGGLTGGREFDNRVHIGTNRTFRKTETPGEIQIAGWIFCPAFFILY